MLPFEFDTIQIHSKCKLQAIVITETEHECLMSWLFFWMSVSAVDRISNGNYITLNEFVWQSNCKQLRIAFLLTRTPNDDCKIVSMTFFVIHFFLFFQFPDNTTSSTPTHIYTSILAGKWRHRNSHISNHEIFSHWMTFVKRINTNKYHKISSVCVPHEEFLSLLFILSHKSQGLVLWIDCNAESELK